MMWEKSLLVFFFSVSVQKEALDCEMRTKMKEFPPPSLESKMNAVTKGQHVSLSCFNKNKSVEITYSLFRNKTHLKSQKRTGEPMIFNLTISEDHELGPYKCKAQVSNCSKYSLEFNFTFIGGGSKAKNCPFCLQLLLPGLLVVLIVIILILAFWIIPKYKAKGQHVQEVHYATPVFWEAAPGNTGKSMKENAPRNQLKEVKIYKNICENKAETEHTQEIHYATLIFQEVEPGNGEASNDCKAKHVCSEFNF